MKYSREQWISCCQEKHKIKTILDKKPLQELNEQIEIDLRWENPTVYPTYEIATAREPSYYVNSVWNCGKILMHKNHA